MKKLTVILLMIISMLAIAGCSKNNGGAVSDSQQSAQAAITPTAVPSDNATGSTEAGSSESTAAGSTAAADKININIAALKGPTAIGMVKIMDDAAQSTTANNYKFTVAGTADEISAGLIKGDYDIAAVPSNLASVLYNKTNGAIKVAGINTLGVLYIVETGNSIKTVEDLKGKTIYTTGFGTTPQYTLNYLLSSYGIDPDKDVKIEYKTEATEVAAMLTNATDAVAMLPQPYVATVIMSNNKVRIALNVAEEWDKVNKDGSSVVTGVLVARKDFLEKNKDAFAKFMEEYKASADYANSNVDEAAALVEKFDIFKAAAAKQAIPYCSITLISGEDMKSKVGGYLKTLYDQNPKSVGGKLPDDNFYYIP